MSDTLEIVRFTVDPADRGEFLARRPAAIEALRAEFAGLRDARLGECEDGTWIDVVRWRSRDEAEAAAARFPTLPGAREWVGTIAEVQEMLHAPVRHAVTA